MRFGRSIDRKHAHSSHGGIRCGDITPVAYLASQVVAGFNHRYLCRIKAVAPDAKEYYAFVTVFEDLNGNASITKISTTDVETNINGLAGGWFQASSAKVTKQLRTEFNDALMGLVGVCYNPVAVLSEQVVAGMNYCLLCESQVVYPGAPKYYTLVYLYVRFDGTSEITDIVRIADGYLKKTTRPEGRVVSFSCN